MAHKRALVFLCWAGMLVSARALADDEPVVAGLRDSLVAQVRPGHEHALRIREPVRRVTTEQLGSAALTKPAAVIAIVGPITDSDVLSMLKLVERDVVDTTRITGDQEFAVVQLGDPQRDPCCTTTVLFTRKNGSWANLGAITQSH